MLLLSVKGWETWCHKTQVRWQGVQFCTNWSRFDSHDNSMMLGVFEFLFVIRCVQDTLQFCWSVLKVYGSFLHHLVCGCELCSQPQSFVYLANPAHQSTITFFRWYLKTRFVLWAWDGLWNCKMVAIWRMETRPQMPTQHFKPRIKAQYVFCWCKPVSGLRHERASSMETMFVSVMLSALKHSPFCEVGCFWDWLWTWPQWIRLWQNETQTSSKESCRERSETKGRKRLCMKCVGWK